MVEEGTLLLRAKPASPRQPTKPLLAVQDALHTIHRSSFQRR